MVRRWNILCLVGLAIVPLLWLHIEGPHEKAHTFDEESSFFEIVKYWQKEFPRASGAESYRLTDGPQGNRTHIFVPVEIKGLYLRNYGDSFLSKKVASHGWEGTVAADLHLLKKERLFTYSGKMGYDSEKMIACTVYVIENGRKDARVFIRPSILNPP